MDTLLEKIDGIKQQITDQDYIDIMEALGQARRTNKVSLYNVDLLVSLPEKSKYRTIKISQQIEKRLVMMKREFVEGLKVGQGISFRDEGMGRISEYSVWEEKEVEMCELEDTHLSGEIDISFVKYRFLGAEKIEVDMEEVDLESD